PHHGRWAHWFRRLRYVVIDECHAYRGVFGSHVALVLRRLLRVCARYDASPTLVLASATVAGPAEFASRLTGRPVTSVTRDGSPRAGRTVALWEPPLMPGAVGENGAPVRRSAATDAARMIADLVVEGARSIAFLRSRGAAERAAIRARRLVADIDPALADRVDAYRGGYLPEDRRSLEAALTSGRILGMASTNALELGVDIVGLDAVVMAGFPGSLASFWQQAGRAGRDSRSDALVVLVAADDPMDTYLVHHPEALLRAPVEGCVLDAGNPHLLGPHLACAAAELPITDDELRARFGDGAAGVLDDLVADGVLRRRASGWFWPSVSERPAGHVDIRGSGLGQVALVEQETGRVLGTVDRSSAPATAHAGAVHLHRGETFLVDRLDLVAGVALVRAHDPGWYTVARSVSDVAVRRVLRSRDHGDVRVSFGEVDVTTQVVAYQRRTPEGVVVATVPLDLPEQALATRAVWYEVAPGALRVAGLAAARTAGALHAAEHAAIGMLPLFAFCDRRDVAGLSTVAHPFSGRPTVFVHDRHPGGAGFAERGHAVLAAWLGSTREAITDCTCQVGCPSCVQSAQCGSGNAPLDKEGAALVLDIVVAALTADGGRDVAGCTAEAGFSAARDG
ncbi:MAG: DEAD/DEAH box helicase, partial [Pseudonocardia sp.]|nr:DEAD/DEAH box helicase [Pseudonocardia sp.]